MLSLIKRKHKKLKSITNPLVEYNKTIIKFFKKDDISRELLITFLNKLIYESKNPINEKVRIHILIARSEIDTIKGFNKIQLIQIKNYLFLLPLLNYNHRIGYPGFGELHLDNFLIFHIYNPKNNHHLNIYISDFVIEYNLYANFKNFEDNISGSFKFKDERDLTLFSKVLRMLD